MWTLSVRSIGRISSTGELSEDANSCVEPEHKLEGLCGSSALSLYHELQTTHEV